LFFILIIPFHQKISKNIHLPHCGESPCRIGELYSDVLGILVDVCGVSNFCPVYAIGRDIEGCCGGVG